MSDYSINPVTNVKSEVAASSAPLPQEQTVVATAGARQGLLKPQENQAKPAVDESADKAVLPISSMADVSLRFRVDEKTKNITVYIVDRESKRILRSIPPEELNKLQAGDLLQLFA
jgi:uncharacterized FlaG/YvyC family protein